MLSVPIVHLITEGDKGRNKLPGLYILDLHISGLQTPSSLKNPLILTCIQTVWTHISLLSMRQSHSLDPDQMICWDGSRSKLFAKVTSKASLNLVGKANY